MKMKVRRALTPDSKCRQVNKYGRSLLKLSRLYTFKRHGRINFSHCRTSSLIVAIIIYREAVTKSELPPLRSGFIPPHLLDLEPDDLGEEEAGMVKGLAVTVIERVARSPAP
jgi:hypothetical protein